MKKAILIPTDFTIESLKFVVEAAESAQSNIRINIVFLHCERLQDAIVDLLFYSKRELIDSLKTPDFTNACQVILNKYPSTIHSMRFEIFTGHNQRAFENFLVGNRIDEILVPKNYALQFGKNSFDPLPFIQRVQLPVKEVAWELSGDLTEKNQFAELFLT
ncbi:MAG: hypothetical protein MUF39_04850 [Cyclobacteriaceae bacterium]|jgi:hypothetical protein|nr:hypothetical protein [Cyclobacteriaceae bacterium]